MGLFDRKSAWEKEWEQVLRKESAYLKRGSRKKESFLDKKLEAMVPDGLQNTLDTAFSKAFALIFEKGTKVIEKTYRKEQKERNFKMNRYAAELKEDRKNLSAFRKEAAKAGNVNLLMSGVEGVGLGLLGIGLPDIPLFTGMLLKSIYETAISFGYSYETEEERLFILKLIEASLSDGEELVRLNRALEVFMRTGDWSADSVSEMAGQVVITNKNALPEQMTLNVQTKRTAGKLSGELLYMKFLQGIPVAGAVGGLYDAIYMQKIQQYAGLQYQKRFLIEQRRKPHTEGK